MKTSDLIKYYGSRDEAMKLSGASRQLWNHWEKHGIPIGRQARLQIQTRGKLKADLGESLRSGLRNVY